jgi:hypothetical protein
MLNNNPVYEVKEMLSESTKVLPVEDGWRFFVDGIPVSRELHDFVEGFNKIHKGVKYHLAESKKLHFENEDRLVPLAKSLYVYRDNVPFIYGAVGYGDYSLTKSDTKSYMVFSRKISNDKYNKHNAQHRMSLTVNLHTALKNASKGIAPYTSAEIAKYYFKFPQDKVRDVVYQAKLSLGNIVEPICASREMSTFVDEMMYLIDSGVEFKNQTFMDMAKNLKDKANTLKELQNRKVGLTFVSFKHGANVSVEMLDVENVNNLPIYESNFLNYASNVTTCSMENLPESISSRVAVLNILSDKQYVERVGMKIDDNTFWVERG